MQSVMFLLAAAVACFVLNEEVFAQKMILMENFDPAQVEGVWYTVGRTGALYNDSASCTKYEVKHENGRIYEVVLNYRDKSNAVVKNAFRVVEDSDHPAQFFFADKGWVLWNTPKMALRTPEVRGLRLRTTVRNAATARKLQCGFWGPTTRTGMSASATSSETYLCTASVLERLCWIPSTWRRPWP
ncbi:uncharacterized protein LOC119159362 isoform X2 [Rhipicephalus microplus]|uniref:uncharacterized protein LOC119159362 isoform X2 n=1 Tax=Rhipicephalus microplus TaxID=6941 RepID=UPI003F6C4BBE